MIVVYSLSSKPGSKRPSFLTQCVAEIKINVSLKIVTPLRRYDVKNSKTMRIEHGWANLGNRGTSYLYFVKKKQLNP